MPESTTPQLTESEVAKIEERDWFLSAESLEKQVALTITERDALVRDWRAMRAENETWATWHVREGVNGCGHHPCHQYDLRPLTDSPKATHGCVSCELTKAEQTNAALREQLEAEDKDHRLTIETFQQQERIWNQKFDEQEQANAALREQLAQLTNYASHFNNCEWRAAIPRTTCTCGLADILEKLK